MSKEYYSVLARTISAAAEDHAQLRNIVYSLARIELRKELRRRYKIELEQQTTALEGAIAKIESDFLGEAAIPQLTSIDGTYGVAHDSSGHTAVTVWEGPSQTADAGGKWEVLAPIPDWPRSRAQASEPTIAREAPSRVWWRLQILLAAAGGLAIYLWSDIPRDFRAVISRYTPFQLTASSDSSSSGQAATAATSLNGTASNNNANAQSTMDGVPLPTSYGVYAISGGKLIDLGLLPIKVPDPRVAISAMISSPSETVLADGHVQFVVFRRDLLNDAPDRVFVRVVARVMRELTFSPGGKANWVKVDGSWAVRGNSYEMKVAPVS
ncbi:MAG TPA: hypothetical protein VJ728_14550, partial [Candidatus Binataceae bacterium]|nr:hypothetical protein [Candidatus Binataceae bacterium]